MNVVKDKIEPKPFLPKKGNNRGLLGLIGLISLMGLISLGLMGCGGGGGDDRTGQMPTTPPTPPTTDPTDPTEPPTPPTPTEVAISFSGNEEEARTVEQGGNRASRRAGTPLSKSATSFKVWGYKNTSGGDLQTVFPGYTVNWISGSASSTTSNTNGWEYVAQQTGGDPEQTIKYWDMKAEAYRFFAVTGSPTHESHDTNHEFTMTANCSGATDEAIAANMAETPFFSHLWFSTSTNVDKQFGKPVTLEFLKPFARVRFMFNYSYAPEGVKVTGPSFKPTDDIGADEENKVKIARKGTVKVTYPLTGTAITESYTVTVDDDKSTRLDAFTEEYIPEGTEKWYIVLPVASQGSYTMSVSVNGTAKTAVVPKEYMSWKPGYSYTYIFKITEEGGVVVDLVQTAVTPWTDMTIVHSVYNW